VPAASTSPAAAACQPTLPHAAGNFNESLQSGGLTRTYVLRIPSGYAGSARVPLVVAYHGYGMAAAQFAAYDGFDAAADNAGFIVVTPDGTGEPTVWNTAKSPGAPDDVQFTKDLIASLQSELCVDAARIFTAGYSLGGGMALRVACDLPDTVAAVAAVAALYPNCVAPVPLIAFHGTADAVVPFEGRDPTATTGASPVVRRSVSEWARTLGCDGLPLISRPAAEVELSTFQRCPYGTGDALLYTIIGGGHTWPGATFPLPENVFGKTTAAINATDTIWRFFAAHPRAH